MVEAWQEDGFCRRGVVEEALQEDGFCGRGVVEEALQAVGDPDADPGDSHRDRGRDGVAGCVDGADWWR